MYGRNPDGSVVFLGPLVGRPTSPGPGASPSPRYRLTAMPAPGPQGIAFVNALARSPSPNFRDRIPASFSFSEAPRPREVPCGRTAVDPRAKRPVACAAWAHNFPIQGGKRMIGKMDSVEAPQTGIKQSVFDFVVILFFGVRVWGLEGSWIVWKLPTGSSPSLGPG